MTWIVTLPVAINLMANLIFTPKAASRSPSAKMRFGNMKRPDLTVFSALLCFLLVVTLVGHTPGVIQTWGCRVKLGCSGKGQSVSLLGCSTAIGITGRTMSHSQGSVIEFKEEEAQETRKFLSPTRVLLRSFRLSRDNWRQKHHEVQAKLEQERQLSGERGQSRDRWRSQCEAAAAHAAAELVAQQRLGEDESLPVQGDLTMK
jgi:hypothetical protein